MPFSSVYLFFYSSFKSMCAERSSRKSASFTSSSPSNLIGSQLATPPSSAAIGSQLPPSPSSSATIGSQLPTPPSSSAAIVSQGPLTRARAGSQPPPPLPSDLTNFLCGLCAGILGRRQDDDDLLTLKIPFEGLRTEYSLSLVTFGVGVFPFISTYLYFKILHHCPPLHSVKRVVWPSLLTWSRPRCRSRLAAGNHVSITKLKIEMIFLYKLLPKLQCCESGIIYSGSSYVYFYRGSVTKFSTSTFFSWNEPICAPDKQANMVFL